MLQKIYATQKTELRDMTMDKFEQFCNDKTLAKCTKSLYLSSVRAYTGLNGLTLDELIEEADFEEEKGIRWKRRTLKTRLVNFRTWLFANKSQGTANRYLGCVKTIYRHFEIELQDLPSFNSKQVDKTYEKTYDDLPTKDELILAYYEATNIVKNFLVFGISTGMSQIDILKLTVRDFIEACSEYISKLDDSLIAKIHQILNSKNPIPCFKGNRQKTGTAFVTFCSPEATEHICHDLIGRDAEIRKKYDAADNDEKGLLPCKLELDDPLFKIDPDHLMKSFREINTKLKFGVVGKYVKLRTHQLRSYHASTLLNLDENPFTISEVDALQGRKKDKTHRAYFMESTSKLRQKYFESVDSLMLFKSIHVVDNEMYKELKQENEFYKEELVKQEKKSREQEEKINMILQTQKEIEALVGL